MHVPRVKRGFRLVEEKSLELPLDLRRLRTNVIVEFLEEQMRLRELPLEKQAKKLLRRR